MWSDIKPRSHTLTCISARPCKALSDGANPGGDSEQAGRPAATKISFLIPQVTQMDARACLGRR